MNDKLMFDLVMDYFDESTGVDHFSITRHFECDTYSELYQYVHELYKDGFYNISVYDIWRGDYIDVY